MTHVRAAKIATVSIGRCETEAAKSAVQTIGRKSTNRNVAEVRREILGNANPARNGSITNGRIEKVTLDAAQTPSSNGSDARNFTVFAKIRLDIVCHHRRKRIVTSSRTSRARMMK
jgi:hypothetical protein